MKKQGHTHERTMSLLADAEQADKSNDLKAKFTCTLIEDIQNIHKRYKRVNLSAAYHTVENKDFADKIPSASVEMLVEPGTSADDYFAVGTAYCLTITKSK